LAWSGLPRKQQLAPLCHCNIEDLLADHGIDISQETVQFWWRRPGPIFAAEIAKKRVAHMRGFTQRRRHLDEVSLKINGKFCYLRPALDHEGEALETVVAGEAGQGRGGEVSETDHEEMGSAAERRHWRAFLLFCGDEREIGNGASKDPSRAAS
jgi:hypothetical protein